MIFTLMNIDKYRKLNFCKS